MAYREIGKALCYHFSHEHRETQLLKHPRPSRTKTASTKPEMAGQLRIIGGQWRGRKLSFPAVDGLRPTGDRIRETLFNWLAAELPDARCLDLFAGSGALGLEALSRGAASSLLVERDRLAAQQIADNLILLKAENGCLIHSDALDLLKRGNQQPGFDVVFIDPPFQLNLWQAVVDALEAGSWLAENATIYVESPPGLSYRVPASWHLHRDKLAGQVSYRLYYRGLQP